MKTKIRITFIFFLIAAIFGLLLRLIQTGTPLYNYKNLLHTHSHIALLGWLYNAALILLQYSILKKQNGSMNWIFWVTQLTFVGMLFSFPFEGYGLFSITFSTLYLFCSYFLVYHLFKQSKELSSKYTAKFIQWGGIYLILSSIGPYALGIIMANKLADTFWYKLSIYWFLHFLYNGFFVFIVFAYLLNRFQQLKNEKTIFLLMNISVIPLFGLSTLWLKPTLPFYAVAFFGALFQIIAFILLIKGQKLQQYFTNKLSLNLFVLSLIAYILKIIFQIFASFENVQSFINLTVSSSVVGFIHLVMLGFFTLFFISIFIEEKKLKTSYTLKIGIYLLVSGIVLSEALLFTQSITIYFFQESISNYFDILFWVSFLMPIGIALITVQSLITFKSK